MRTTFIAALLPNATAKVQKNLHIRKKISLTGLDSLDFCRRQGCNSPARFAREIQTIPTNNCSYSLDSASS
jgi:hypothetical protein